MVFVAHARSGSPAILLGGVVADEIWVLDLIWSTPKWQMLNTTKRKARISTQNPSDIRRPASVTCREQIQSFPQTRLSACHEAKNKKGQGKTARGMWGRGCFVLATFISRDKCCCSPAPVWGLCRHSSARSSVTCPYTALHVCIAICSARMGATLPHASPRPLPAHRGKFCLQAFSANNDRVSGVPMTFFFTPSVVCALDGHVTSTKFVGWTRLPGCQKDHRKKRRVLVSHAAARVPREPY